MIEQIIITDRETVEHGLSVKVGTFAVISIVDPNGPIVRIPKSSALRAVLELRFHDAEPSGSFKLPPDITLMSEDDAKQVAEFALQHRGHINVPVVHCEQGMSRSPAVGAAVAAALRLDITTFDRDYQPNTYVRELVFDAFAAIEVDQSDEGTPAK